jgi:hypothetical protein
MKATQLLLLEDIKVISFQYGLNDQTIKNRKTPKTILEAADLDFDFKVQDNKQDKKKKRILFYLSSNNDSLVVNFKIGLIYQFSFLKEHDDEKVANFVGSVLIPQIISFLRGYLFAASEKGPFQILLPSMDVFESIKSKFSKQGNVNDQEKKISVTKKK